MSHAEVTQYPQFNIDEKASFNIENTTEMAFVDVIDFPILIEMMVGEQVNIGGLPNVVTHLEHLEFTDNNVTHIRDTYRFQFYQFTDEVYVVKNARFHTDSYDPIETGVYWFDSHNSKMPSDHPQWEAILACLDIYMDKADMSKAKAFMPQLH